MTVAHANLLETLTAPIRQDSPAGDSLRYDEAYDRIANARKAERDLPQGVWQRATKRADWTLVEQLCVDTLSQRTKDLQIAVWLTEAWLHLRGLSGLTDGLALIRELHDRYGFNMYPVPEAATAVLPLPESDPAVEHRMNLIQWLNEKLSIQVKLLPLTDPIDPSVVAVFSLADFETAQMEDQAMRRQNTVPGPDSRLHQFNRSVALTPVPQIVNTWRQVKQAINAADDLDRTLDQCYARANSGLGQLRRVLQDMALAIAPGVPPTAQELSQSLETLSAIAASQDTEEDAVASSNHRPIAPLDAVSYAGMASEAGPLRSREEAYLRLHEIAEYLAFLEPHSPVPYLLRRAIVWGGMSLRELLPELLQDPAALREVGHLLQLDQVNRNAV